MLRKFVSQARKLVEESGVQLGLVDATALVLEKMMYAVADGEVATSTGLQMQCMHLASRLAQRNQPDETLRKAADVFGDEWSVCSLPLLSLHTASDSRASVCFLFVQLTQPACCLLTY